MSRQKNRGISVTSRDKRDKESIRSSSKVKFIQPSSNKLSARQISTKPERHIRTVASINDSVNFSKRMETENSPMRRRVGTINSIFFDSKVIEDKLAGGANKENKPSLNLMRRNRFR